MQNIISANQKSVTESEATKDAMIPYYSASKAMPELGKQFQKVNPFITFTGAAAGNSMTFKLPPGSGFLYEASLGFTCTCTLAAADLTNYIGINMIQQIDWLSNGQPILTQTGPAIKALIKTLPVAQQTFSYRYALPLVPATENVATGTPAEFLTYTPLIASWLSETQKCLLLNQIGDLQLRVTFATTVASGLTNAITAISSAVLFCETYMSKLSVYNQQVLNDWSKTLIMETFNVYTEVVPLTTSTTVSNYQITCPFLCYRTHLIVQNTNVSGAGGAKVWDIYNVSMNIGGVTFLDTYKKSRLLSNKAKWGVSSFVTTNDTAVVYDSAEALTIDWNLQSTRDKNTGTAFFAELRGSVLSVTFEDVTTAGNATLFIINEYWQNTAYNPGSGGSNGILSVYQNS